MLSIQDKGPEPEKNWLLARGNPLDPKDELELAFLQVIGPATPEDAGFPIQRRVDGRSSGQRSSLAAWMTDVERGAGRYVHRPPFASYYEALMVQAQRNQPTPVKR